MTSSDAGSSLEAWTLALARPTITPAGGSAAAISGALAASLVAMVAGITLDRQRYAAVHVEAAQLRGRAEQLRSELLELAGEDARAFADFSDALKLPANTEGERSVREAAKRNALAEGARVQLDVLQRAADVASMCEHLAAMAPPSTVGDVATGAFLAAAAARSAYWAVRSDLGEEMEEARSTLGRAETAERQISALLAERLG